MNVSSNMSKTYFESILVHNAKSYYYDIKDYNDMLISFLDCRIILTEVFHKSIDIIEDKGIYSLG